MGVHVAGTQHGHTYYLGPLEGTRAPALIALRSRAPAAHVEFWQLQHAIWQIEGGLSYNDMSADSQQLIDRLIPEYKGQLRDNFVKTIQKTCGGLRGSIFGSLCNDMNTLNERYQQAQQTLQRYGNNYDALAQQIVHVIPGVYQNPGPQSWSRLNPRVYARVTGGHIWQEMGTVEIRVLPGATVTTAMASKGAAGSLRNVSYSLTGGAEPRVDNDTADVPIEAVVAYPDVGAGAQVLGIGLDGGGGSSGTLEVLNYNVTARPQTYTLFLPPRTIVDPSCSSVQNVTKSNCLPKVVYDYISYNTTLPTEAYPITLTLTVKNSTNASVQPPPQLTASAAGAGKDTTGTSSPTFTLTLSNGPASVSANSQATLAYTGTPRWTSFQMVSPSNWVYQDVQTAAEANDVQGNVATLLSFIHDVPVAGEALLPVLSAAPNIALGFFSLLTAKGVFFFQFQVAPANLNSSSAITFYVLDQPQKFDVFAAYMIGVFSGMANVTPIPTADIDAALSGALQALGNNVCAYQVLSHSPLPDYGWFYNGLTNDLTQGQQSGIALSTVLGEQLQCVH